MTIISDEGPGLGQVDVSELEAQIGKLLPPSYREFLLTHNGGVPTPDVVDIPGFDQSPTDVQQFFGLGLQLETSRIDWHLDTLRLRLRGELVPIGCDSGGNVFVLSVRARDEGAVLYLDLEAVYGDLDTSPPEYPVAADFDEFLGRLREF
jgi:hypothetical protein